MKRWVIRQLKEKVLEAECFFSGKQREFNHNGEIFRCKKIQPLSDTCAAVTFGKDTGKDVVGLFFYIKNYWMYFFPNDGHELGMWNYLSLNHRLVVEEFNVPHNFDSFSLDDIKEV